MDTLLGPKLLLTPGAPVPTCDALKGQDLVLLYFSASWCPPCKRFTPILKEFYNSTCKKHNVQIIFISSDKSVESFHEYFSSMPWLSLPMSEESVPFANLLSSKLSVRSIPQLVVLDASGRFVTNNAVSQITNIGNDSAQCDQIISSWKTTEAVPIDQMKKGIIGSIFSKVKKSYNFVVGSDSNTDELEGGGYVEENCDASPSSKVEHQFTSNAHAILAFFNEANARLKEHPIDSYREQLLVPSNEDSAKDNYFVPVSLETHRQILIKVQMQALERSVFKINEEKSTSISTKEIQEHLRALGGKDFGNITNDEEVQTKLLDQMNEMNENARMAFARSVLWSETQWSQQEQKESGTIVDYRNTNRKLKQKDDGILMQREDILEFCGLCTVAVKMTEVELHLQSGNNIFKSIATEEEYLVHDKSTAPQRMLQLQNMMLCAVGFEPSYGGEELYRVMTNDLNENKDEEVEGALSNYSISIQVAAKKAMDAGLNQGLSDKDEGGVTKVVSVKFSEKMMDTKLNGEAVEVGDVAPSRAKMEQHSERFEREQLKMAAQAASLQNSILEKLDLMEEEERDKELARAKSTHQNFVQKTMSLPPGAERVAYLQSISSEEQHLLLMYKLWESRKQSSDS